MNTFAAHVDDEFSAAHAQYHIERKNGRSINILPGTDKTPNRVLFSGDDSVREQVATLHCVTKVVRHR